jgi:TATA-binding protein-associated factor Taf7
MLEEAEDPRRVELLEQLGAAEAEVAKQQANVDGAALPSLKARFQGALQRAQQAAERVRAELAAL